MAGSKQWKVVQACVGEYNEEKGYPYLEDALKQLTQDGWEVFQILGQPDLYLVVAFKAA